MPLIRCAFARAMACACLLTAGPAFAQNLLSGKVTTGTPTFVNDQNVPLQLDATGALKVTGGTGGGGASTVAGSMEQDVRATGTLNAATLNAAITTPINGQATVGYAFTGLTGTGATLTYEQSIDGGATWTGINAVNRGTGVPEATRTTDGQIALSATGRTGIRVRVSTAGTGTITVATNVSVREGIFSLGSPLPPGANAIGSVVANLQVAGAPNTSGNPVFTQITNFPATQSVQGINGGFPQAVSQQGSSLAAVGITPAITPSGTAVVGKASQGNLYSAYAVNTTATAGYLVCINATAAPATGAAITPIDVQTLAGAVGATASINYGPGPPNAYSTGIACLVTTSLTTYTAGGASFIQARVR